MLIILTNLFLINTLLLAWEYPLTPLEDIEEHDVGIVLTGITRYDKSPKDRVYFAQGADRVMHALMLYREGKIKKILITGATVTITGGVQYSEASALRKVLLTAKVPKEDIVIEEEARNTRENAVFTKEILEEKFPKQRYILITSAFHMRRAKACFEKVGLAFTPFSAGVLTSDFSRMGLYAFLPSEQALYLWYILVHEVLGYLVYAMVGYI